MPRIISAKRDRLVLDLADRDGDRDQFEREKIELKTERDQALQSLFTRLVEVVASVSASASLLPAISVKKASLPRQQR